MCVVGVDPTVDRRSTHGKMKQTLEDADAIVDVMELDRRLEAALGGSCPAPSSSVLAAAGSPPQRFIQLDDHFECGLGCTLSFLVKPLIWAVDDGAVVVGVPFSRWFKGERILSPLPPSSHACGGAAAAAQKRLPGDFSERMSGVVPRGFEHRGLLWSVGRIVKAVLAERNRGPVLVKALQRAREASGLLDEGLERPVLGLHVRLGDSCIDDYWADKGRTCDPFERYLPAVRRLVARHGFKSVFVATDSATVIDDAERLLPLEGLRLLHNPLVLDERREYDRAFSKTRGHGVAVEGLLTGEKALQGYLTDTSKLATNYLVDLIILAEDTAGFVGKFSSNMGRLVMALKVASSSAGGTCIPPYESLDATWCADFGMRTGRSRVRKGAWKMMEKGQDENEGNKEEEEEEEEEITFFC